ncbi:MAG: hypothetical protein ACI8RD_010083, partial [Bacillariaceae sp.]
NNAGIRKLTSIYDMKVLIITINHTLIQWDIKLPKMYVQELLYI